MSSLTTHQPAAPFADEKTAAAAAVEAARDEILDLSHRIHATPEPAFEEVQAAGWVADAIRAHGFEVEHPAGRLATAVRGRLAGGKGTDGPRIGILAEYDALPGLGHGCGHNTMAASGVGAAIALAAVRDSFAGEIVFLGTPAEERGSGKQFMLEDGLFEGLDAALLYHPCDRNHVDCQPLASEDVAVVFKGLQSHAASEPWEGRNALDAMIALFSSVGLWRQQLPPHCRVHGIIQEGGTAANIIPDRTRAWFMVRSADQAYYEVMKERFRRLCEAAAIAADVEVEVEFSGFASTMKTNRAIADRWVANAAAYGIEDQGPGRDVGLDGHGQRLVGRAGHPPGPVDHGRRDPGPLDRVPRRGGPPARRRDGPHGGHARRPDRARPVPRPVARRGRVARVQGRVTDAQRRRR